MTAKGDDGVVKRYQRRDEAGRNVDVEIWLDENTCQVTMLRLITHFPDGEIRKFRSDFPNDGSQEFERAIRREIDELEIHMGILATLKDVLEQAEKEPERMGEDDAEGIGWLAQLFPPNG